MPAEPFDVYSDYTSYWINHWGTNICFFLNSPLPNVEGRRDTALLGTVRVSNEHLKILLFNMCRTLVSEEQRTGASYDATDEVLEGAGISREGWSRFWDAAGGVK